MTASTPGWVIVIHRHRGYANIEGADVLADLPDEILLGSRSDLRIETSAPPTEAHTIDWTALQAEQAGQVANLLAARTEGKGIVYVGRTSLPLALDLGYRVESWTKSLVLPYDRVRHRWGFPGRAADDPEFTVHVDDDSLPGKASAATGDVVIRVSVSDRIDPGDTRACVPDPIAELDLHLGEACGSTSLRTHDDLERVVSAFQALLTKVHNRLPKRSRLHLFVSCPAGLAFRLGCVINHNIHPVIQTYEYSSTAQPKYHGALVLGQEPALTLKLQFITATPKTSSALRTGEEQREIRDALRDGEHRDRFAELPEPRPAAQATDLQKYIRRDRAHIIHFSGHADGDGSLVLEDSKGNPERVRPETLRMLFKLYNHAGHIRCVVLNACNTRDMALALVREPAVIPCVIATTAKVCDKAAIAFSVAFYSALADGESLARAVEAGQVQVQHVDSAHTDHFELHLADEAMRDKPLFER
ncbi:SAVED domain-containing protein [Haliangium sp.]|uniref:SAVED domain-containing protein n=1 Tax=Haliangium sp. TaxID=2663208 RepID=UPI003D125FF7